MKNLIYLFVLLGLVSCKKGNIETKTKNWVYTEEKLDDGTVLYTEERVEEIEPKKQKTPIISFDEINKVEILSYPSRMDWDIKQDGTFSESLKILDDKLSINRQFIMEDIFLSELQKKELLDLLKKDICGKNGMSAGCFEPRHLIVFYDKNNNTIAYYEICLGCGVAGSSENLEQVPSFCVEKAFEFEKLFRKFGIKYIGEDKRKDEYKIVEELKKNINNKEKIKGWLKQM
jgi:hypothetical protein